MTSTSRAYRPDIDGLRAIAVLAVMLYHLDASWLPGGFVGVDIFFVISGYVVTASLAKQTGAPLGRFIREFYVRRLARILPALLAMLCLSAVLAVLFIPQAWLSRHGDDTARYALFGLSNLFLQLNDGSYFAPRAEFNPFTHTWSLGVEEQFYLLAPLLVFGWLQVTLRRKSLAVWAVLALGSLAVCIGIGQAHRTFAFYFIGCRFWELAAGSLLFMFSEARRPGAHRTHAAPWVTGVGMLALLGSLLLTPIDRFPWPGALAPVVGTLLIILGGSLSPQGPVQKVLSQPAMLWIGLRSYSLYLWHWPVYVLMRWTTGLDSGWAAAGACAITVVLAAASYRWIERPFRHHPALSRQLPSVQLALLLAFPVVGLAVLSLLFEARPLISLASASRNANDWTVTPRMTFPERGLRACQVRIEEVSNDGLMERRYTPTGCAILAGSQTVYVVGDSHAGAMAPQYEQFAAETGTRVRMFSVGGCGYLDFKSPMRSARNAACARFAEKTTQLMLDQSARGDVVLLPSLRLERYGDQWSTASVTDMYALVYKPENASLRQAALQEALEISGLLRTKDLAVVFAEPLPVFKAPPFRCADWFNRHNPICAGGTEMPRSEVHRLRQPIVDAMRQVADRSPGVGSWDPMPVLYPGEVCLTSLAGRPLFFDGDHLSGYGNFALYPSLKAKLLLALSARQGARL